MNNPAGADRVANLISTFKWIVIGIAAVVAVVVFVAFASQGGAGAAAGLLVLIGVGVYCIILYVMFGWFEQTLRMLANIATNTGITAGTIGRPEYPTPPPSPYGP